MAIPQSHEITTLTAIHILSISLDVTILNYDVIAQIRNRSFFSSISEQNSIRKTPSKYFKVKMTKNDETTKTRRRQ